MFRSKGIYTLAIFFLISLFVAACGNEEPIKSKQASTDPAPRTIKHAMGETKITGTPQRIVVLTNQGTETLLELGIKPVGAVKSWIGDPWYDHIKDKMTDVEVVGDETQPNIELIASLKPDLILGTKVRHEKIYQQLSSIAPTVFTENLGNSMVENFRLFAQALNKETEGTAVLDDYNKAIEQTKTRLGDKTKLRISLARFQPGKVRVYYKDNFAGVILNQLGFARPDAQNKDEFSADITKEQIEVLDGDVFFYFTSDREGNFGATQTADEWLKDPLAQNLNVVKKDRAFKVNEPIWNTSGGIISAKLLIKDIEARFENLKIK
ncbi:ABC transporter substrate-binding protein [Aneurinibacillus migulanus]|uniref:ABC transporter substrate-binding protein n=1 Tax=Aneurinibacillus migulanus TaxID=47500 RepID=UPI0005B81AF6|nr:iron-siderophore ABC transporter substrate-binding protein [Aneurinibacillus migulanus]KIV51604.1 ABC transporter substrate-binding protein [Aneurinibacillus migulanus]KPD08264.1 ABC transporter substrate-binding protein [Aneurinibacillus migulanus]CEH31229.1 Periplasmic binding protein [Aneurinibacillus migulanus]